MMTKWMTLVLGLFFSAMVLAAPVNINTASAEQIAESLNGVGEVKAKAIVDYRKAHGDFKSADDLQNVKGIGAKLVDKNRADILLVSSKLQ
ncbi:MAG: ComEA family DNA-binding protein [Hydrogenovibrio sp.]